MPLRKAKEPDWDEQPRLHRHCLRNKAEMIRRVEELHEELSKLPAIAFLTADDPWEPFKQCHADLCEIAGVERENENDD